MSKDLEARLLASVPSIEHFEHLEDKGITEGSFQFYKPMYLYIKEIVGQHHHLPRLVDLKATFNIPDHVQRKPEEFEWLLTEFLNLSIVERISSIFDRSIEQFGDAPMDLLPALIKDLTSLSVPDQRQASVSDATAMDRLEEYIRRSENDEIIMGIPTGIRYFDAHYRLGFMPGELIGVIGRIHVGKSWMLMYHGIKAWMGHKRVLFLSPEMPKDEAETRLDAMMCGAMGVRIDINDIYHGFKPNKEQRAVFELMKKRGDWITLTSDEGKPFRLGEMPRYLRQFGPDVVLIDGLSLIGSEGRQQPWEQMKDLSYGLKNLAVGTNTVIIVAHQANREAKDTYKPPSLAEISFGDAFAQAADRVMVLNRTRQPKNTLRVTIQKFRKGDSDPEGYDFEFQPTYGIIREREPRENLSVEVEKEEEIDGEDLKAIP